MRARSAFTLIELLVAGALASLLGALVVGVIVKSFSDHRKLEATSVVQRDINLAVDRINKVLRSTTQILEATTTTIKIRGYPNAADVAPSEIYFFIAQHNGFPAVRYSVTPPSGTAPNYTYDPVSATTYTLLPHVANSAGAALFTYYDEENTPLSGTVNIGQIRVVEFTPRALDVGGVLSAPLITATRAQLRNFKDNL